MVLFMKVAVAALSLLVSSICDAKNESTTSQSSSANGIHEKRRMTTQAIIGGSEATAGEYPWFAKAVYTNNDWAGCGGALVSPQVRRMIMDIILSTHILKILNYHTDLCCCSLFWQLLIVLISSMVALKSGPSATQMVLLTETVDR